MAWQFPLKGIRPAKEIVELGWAGGNENLPHARGQTLLMPQPVINVGSTPIPPFGAMSPDGEIDDNGFIQVTAPQFDGQTNLLWNDKLPIAPGAQGQSQPDRFPAIAAYNPNNETNTAPAIGDIWGVQAGSFYLQRSRPGFAITAQGLGGLCQIRPMDTSLVRFVKITSGTPSAGRFPAQEQFLNPVNGFWSTGDTVWFADTNGSILSPVQSSPTATSGGSLTDGTTYYWVITATNASGETLPSAEKSLAISGSNQTAVLTWAAVTGATGYKIYRSTTSGTYTSPALVTTIGSGATVTYNDTGSSASSGSPPGGNTTNPPASGQLIEAVLTGYANGRKVYGSASAIPPALLEVGDGQAAGSPINTRMNVVMLQLLYGTLSTSGSWVVWTPQNTGRIQATGTTTSGSHDVVMSDLTFFVPQVVIGTVFDSQNISGAVTAIDVGSLTITLSNAATASGLIYLTAFIPGIVGYDTVSDQQLGAGVKTVQALSLLSSGTSPGALPNISAFNGIGVGAASWVLAASTGNNTDGTNDYTLYGGFAAGGPVIEFHQAHIGVSSVVPHRYYFNGTPANSSIYGYINVWDGTTKNIGGVLGPRDLTIGTPYGPTDPNVPSTATLTDSTLTLAYASDNTGARTSGLVLQAIPGAPSAGQTAGISCFSSAFPRFAQAGIDTGNNVFYIGGYSTSGPTAYAVFDSTGGSLANITPPIDGFLWVGEYSVRRLACSDGSLIELYHAGGVCVGGVVYLPASTVNGSPTVNCNTSNLKDVGFGGLHGSGLYLYGNGMTGGLATIPSGATIGGTITSTTQFTMSANATGTSNGVLAVSSFSTSPYSMGAGPPTLPYTGFGVSAGGSVSGFTLP